MRTPDANPLATRAHLQRAFEQIEGPLLSVWKDDSAGPDVGLHRAWYGLEATRLEPVVLSGAWCRTPLVAAGAAGGRMSSMRLCMAPILIIHITGDRQFRTTSAVWSMVAFGLCAATGARSGLVAPRANRKTAWPTGWGNG